MGPLPFRNLGSDERGWNRLKYDVPWLVACDKRNSKGQKLWVSDIGIRWEPWRLGRSSRNRSALKFLSWDPFSGRSTVQVLRIEEYSWIWAKPWRAAVAEKFLSEPGVGEFRGLPDWLFYRQLQGLATPDYLYIIHTSICIGIIHIPSLVEIEEHQLLVKALGGHPMPQRLLKWSGSNYVC